MAGERPFVGHGSVESLDVAVGLWPVGLGPTMLYGAGRLPGKQESVAGPLLVNTCRTFAHNQRTSQWAPIQNAARSRCARRLESRCGPMARPGLSIRAEMSSGTGAKPGGGMRPSSLQIVTVVRGTLLSFCARSGSGKPRSVRELPTGSPARNIHQDTQKPGTGIHALAVSSVLSARSFAPSPAEIRSTGRRRLLVAGTNTFHDRPSAVGLVPNRIPVMADVHAPDFRMGGITAHR